jgi:hypothetical protein
MDAAVAKLIFPDRILPSVGEVTVLDCLQAPMREQEATAAAKQSTPTETKPAFGDFGW